MKWVTLISEDGGKSVSMSRVGTWGSIIIILITTILYFINIITKGTFIDIISNWHNIFMVFVGYQGISKVTKHITNKNVNKEDSNNEK